MASAAQRATESRMILSQRVKALEVALEALEMAMFQLEQKHR